MKRKIGAFCLCAMLSISVFLYIGMVVTPKDINDSGGALYYNGTGFLAEPENSLDMVIYGNSGVYSGIVPELLRDQFQIQSYASGKARQSVTNIYKLLEKTLETQKPKMVILETDCFFEERPQGVSDFNVLLPPFVYHSRWKELKLRDFVQLPSRESKPDQRKGFISSSAIYEADYSDDYMGSPDAKPAHITEKNLDEVQNILNLCRENQIEVLLMEMPCPYSWTYSKHNRVAELAQEWNLPFLDLNVERNEYGLDAQKDFRDNGNHLNLYGAEKVTRYVGKYLQTYYGHLL